MLKLIILRHTIKAMEYRTIKLKGDSVWALFRVMTNNNVNRGLMYCTGYIRDEIFEAGEKWHDSQAYLCVDRDVLSRQFNHHNFQLFWIVRLLREATSKAYEKYPELISQNDKCWLAWFGDGELNTQLFSEQVKL